ncbi:MULTISPECIES: hypothetical protein [Lentibacillus]|uniref:hypothetical protein n=1 Tax=Lentibacillus TaxID=175304 RepID=UPI0002626FFA|nr:MULTISPECIES: hypothetical protein [Lentibacillus]QKY71241.1 hypothetical protein Len3610_18315 [Lentibacillus sp. CBA3610]
MEEQIIKGVVAIVVAIIGIFAGGKWYFNKRKITQKNGENQIAIQDSDNNEVNVGEKDEYKKEN